MADAALAKKHHTTARFYTPFGDIDRVLSIVAH
jgi:hypothetical protein